MPAPPLPTTAETGSYGERVAASFLRRQGYKILTRNYKTTRGEIDLVCRLEDILVFVEVKTRAEVDIVAPAETIDEAQQEALYATAQSYLDLLKRDDITYRFDVVEVQLRTGEVPVCKLLPNYFS